MNIFKLLTPKSDSMYLTEDTPITAALDQIRACGYTAIPVIHEDGSYAGTIREGDFLWALIDGLDEDAKGRSMPIQTLVHTGRDHAVKVDVDMDELFNSALNQNFVPIVDDRDMFIGIVTRKHVIEYLISHKPEDAPPIGTL